jgi:hypothetical protein
VGDTEGNLKHFRYSLRSLESEEHIMGYLCLSSFSTEFVLPSVNGPTVFIFCHITGERLIGFQ